jgi:hypothetical protein
MTALGPLWEEKGPVLERFGLAATRMQPTNSLPQGPRGIAQVRPLHHNGVCEIIVVRDPLNS